MKKISAFLALITLFFAGLALAQNSAVVTSTTGTVSVQTGPGPARSLRVGDELHQGDTVFTGAASSVVLKFDDGQVAALTQNSRMTVTRYQYNPESGSGNVLLSLVSGGMRAITGLIGRRTPSNVTYRAATATIGIRGSDINTATDGNDVVVGVNEGAAYVEVAGQITELVAGQAALVRNGTVTRDSINNMMARISALLAQFFRGLNDLTGPIRAAGAGTPRAGSGPTGGPTPSGPTGGPTGGGSGGGLGGGVASPS
jgi:hypothetical protein